MKKPLGRVLRGGQEPQRVVLRIDLQHRDDVLRSGGQASWLGAVSIDDPDLPPPAAALSALTESLSQPTAHKYQSYQGTPALRQTIATYYQDAFDVALNPENEVLPLMGSKEGIMHISMAFLNQGDGVLIPNPGYPTYASVTELVGARAVPYTLSAATNWLPNLEVLAKQDLTGVKLMWVNYPHMPTGAKADAVFLAELVAFAKTHDLLIINDNPYANILNDAPMSLLQVPSPHGLMYST